MALLMEYIGEIGIVGGLILIVISFCIIGFIKGLVKTLMALITLSVSGFTSWWGYNHGSSQVKHYIPEAPEFTNIICSVVGGGLVFYLFYKIFHFIVNPFDGDDDGKKKWNFGFPAASVSFLFALCFVYFVINRMRTTEELDKMKAMMAHGIENAPAREGIHKFIIENLQSSTIGQFIFQNDPLWEQNRAKIAKLAIIHVKSGAQSLAENPQASEILTHPDFLEWISKNSDIAATIEAGDPSALWNSGALEQLLDHPKLSDLLKNLKI